MPDEKPLYSITDLTTNELVLSSILNKNIIKVTSSNLSDAGGLNSTMYRISIETKEGEKETYIIKHLMPSKKSVSMGLPRECFFYELYAETLRKQGVNIPLVYYTFGDMMTGEKIILLQDLKNCIQSGYFFGSGSPLNWGKDLSSLTRDEEDGEVAITALELAEYCFIQAAKMHSKFWKDKTLMGHTFLRGTDWYSGKGKDTFLSSQNYAADAWKGARAKIESGDNLGVTWNPILLEIVDSSISKISFEEFQTQLPKFNWTLAHTDFHPANMMWNPKENTLFILDWEVVGLGSGPQDIAQYLISHMDPKLRKANEYHLLREYYTELIKDGNVTDYSFEDCLNDYVRGGSERWIWFLALLTTLCPPPMVQYFHDQLCAFILDHSVTALSVGMPRV